MNLQEYWRRITATRYTRSLEIEVARLRAENRALLNSILGIAGVPPITVSLPDATAALRPLKYASETGPPEPGSIAANGKSEGGPGSGAKGTLQGASPTRRRSWHQINRTLELQSAKRKSQAECAELAAGESVR